MCTVQHRNWQEEDLLEEGKKENQNWHQSTEVRCFEKRGECSCWNEHVPPTATTLCLRLIKWNACKWHDLANSCIASNKCLNCKPVYTRGLGYPMALNKNGQRPIRRQRADHGTHFQSSEEIQECGTQRGMHGLCLYPAPKAIESHPLRLLN